jgi:prevent-host-death family protein
MVTMVMTMVRLEPLAMRHVKASEFKAKCLKLMDEVQATGEGIIVTKNGKPVATIMPAAPIKGRFYFGMGKGALDLPDDLVTPVFADWKPTAEPAGKTKSRNANTGRIGNRP